MVDRARLVVTNDDGIDAPGLAALVSVLHQAGYEVVVVAPDRDYSGAGSSVMSDGPSAPEREIVVEPRTLDEAPDVEAYAVSGAPALCVLLAVRGVVGPAPDAVVSGINFGVNIGRAVYHSGTVGAAITASRAGLYGLAISAEFDFEHDLDPRYDTAATIGAAVLKAQLAGRHRLMTLNVPRLGVDEVAGVVSADLAENSRYSSTVERIDGRRVKLRYHLDDSVVLDPASDSALLDRGFATVTSLDGFGVVDCSDSLRQLEVGVG